METTTLNPKIITHRRTFTGRVTSAKAKETAVVAVERTVVHPVYHKRYRRTLKLACHNAGNQYHEGDIVRVEECRPLSKTKRWRIIAKI
jgi:small subunit ribosomal protein S17